MLRYNYDNIFLQSLFHSQKYHTDYDKRQLAYICGSDKAIAERVDSGATLLGISKNRAETKLHGDGPGTAYDLAIVMDETSGKTLAFVER